MEQALWFASRATGLVTLVLLTMTMALGMMGAGRYSGTRWPRFTLTALHRNISLTTVVFLAVHSSTAIIDPYAGIGWLDAVLPFGSVYRPFWLGLGAIGADLMIAVLVSSMLRVRISPRLWRLIHLASYACWPVGLVHGWGIGGKDSRLPWVLGLEMSCSLLILVALVWRLRNPAHPDTELRRASVEGRR
ncbi:MAG TPA: ferric reductase-like transmembrane domain-containing protein [Pseudonocardia sp.]|jgi:predicted ferric reductase